MADIDLLFFLDQQYIVACELKAMERRLNFPGELDPCGPFPLSASSRTVSLSLLQLATTLSNLNLKGKERRAQPRLRTTNSVLYGV